MYKIAKDAHLEHNHSNPRRKREDPHPPNPSNNVRPATRRLLRGRPCLSTRSSGTARSPAREPARTASPAIIRAAGEPPGRTRSLIAPSTYRRCRRVRDYHCGAVREHVRARSRRTGRRVAVPPDPTAPAQVASLVTLVGRMGALAVPLLSEEGIGVESSSEVWELAVVRTITTVVGAVTVDTLPLRLCVTVTVSVVVYSLNARGHSSLDGCSGGHSGITVAIII
ncbi:hypothetical protein KC359_g201 [Hortaea werneckii]|nr:hypothetical protein KC359_g201 [Hortaea werneckii]